MNWITLLSSAFLCYLIYLLVRSLNQNLPPGPWGLPFIGYLPFIGSKPGQKFFELSKTYGDVVRVNGLGRSMISLNSYKAIKECFSTKGDEFSGRLNSKDDMLWFLTDGTGYIREEGDPWREHRRFTLHTLRDFGFGKLSLEARVQEIGQSLVGFLQNTKGQPTDPLDLLANAAFNVILYLTMDKHFDPEDEDFIMLRKSIKAILGSLTGFSVIMMATLTKFLPNEWRPGFPPFIKIKKVFDEFIEKVVKEHEETLDKDNPRDFVDAFLIERNEALKKGQDDETTFTVRRLSGNLINLLLAGSETTSSTLYWMLRIVSHRQDIQERIQKELDEVVGRERLPSILDRPNLPYTEAFILELLRYSSIVPTGVPHSNPAPAKLRGYDIPARSLIFANIWGVHNDPLFWTDPEKFDPNRFLDPETKAKRREHVIAFAIGKRSCLGESLARMELFLFMTMLLQKFKFLPQEGDSGELIVQNTLARQLLPFKIRAVPRT